MEERTSGGGPEVWERDDGAEFPEEPSGLQDRDGGEFDFFCEAGQIYWMDSIQ